MKETRWFLCLTALAVFTNFGSPARAAVIVASPAFPPIGEDFIAPPAATFFFPIAGGVEVGHLVLKPISPGPIIPSPPDDETVVFDVLLLGDLSVGGAPVGPVSSTGPAMTVLLGKLGHVTGSFDTEMLSMSLTGVTPLGPFMIRESPTLASTGKTSITDIGGGLYKIDSFFDVFTELSIDGGSTWTPSAGPPVHFELGGPVPEPTALGLLGLSLLGALRRSRRAA